MQRQSPSLLPHPLSDPDSHPSTTTHNLDHHVNDCSSSSCSSSCSSSSSSSSCPLPHSCNRFTTSGAHHPPSNTTLAHMSQSESTSTLPTCATASTNHNIHNKNQCSSSVLSSPSPSLAAVISINNSTSHLPPSPSSSHSYPESYPSSLLYPSSTSSSSPSSHSSLSGFVTDPATGPPSSASEPRSLGQSSPQKQLPLDRAVTMIKNDPLLHLGDLRGNNNTIRGEIKNALKSEQVEATTLTSTAQSPVDKDPSHFVTRPHQVAIDNRTFGLPTPPLSSSSTCSFTLPCPSSSLSSSSSPSTTDKVQSSASQHAHHQLSEHPHIIYSDVLHPSPPVAKSLSGSDPSDLIPDESETRMIADPLSHDRWGSYRPQHQPLEDDMEDSHAIEPGQDSDKDSSSDHPSDHSHTHEDGIDSDEDQVEVDEADERRRSCSAEPTRPLSIKRRKLSEDEGKHKGESFGVDDSSAGGAHGVQESAFNHHNKRSSWPCRKRRSVLVGSTPMSGGSPFSFFEDPASSTLSRSSNATTLDWTLDSIDSTTVPTSNLDTSSLSLLSTTSALVSAGSLFSLQQSTGLGHDDATLPPSTPAPRSRHLPLAAARKRSFEDAIELTRPLGNEPSLEHPGWFESNKRRKIHHFPTRWTSTLSPSPYVKLMAIRDFWDVMMTRLDLSWLDLATVSTTPSWDMGQQDSASTLELAETDDTRMDGSTTISDDDSESNQLKDAEAKVPKETIHSKESAQEGTPSSEWTMCLSSGKVKMLYPSSGMFLKGLWEEEEKMRRKKQMIPDNVHKPLRSKILNGKSIARSKSTRNPSGAWMKAKAGQTLLSNFQSSSSQSSPDEKGKAVSSTDAGSSDNGSASKELERAGSTSQAEQELALKKKHGASVPSRSNALSDGYDLAEYKPWKDGTITPHQGSIRSLNQIRNTVLEPWPAEEALAKDECTRILHRMREQLNVVINLQIHLRSMMKTAPTHLSFLLSIRHPGQVSMELLHALYGPQFMQSSAFRAIEQLLWTKHQPRNDQPKHPLLLQQAQDLERSPSSESYTAGARSDEASRQHIDAEHDPCQFEETGVYEEKAYHDSILAREHQNMNRVENFEEKDMETVYNKEGACDALDRPEDSYSRDAAEKQVLELSIHARRLDMLIDLDEDEDEDAEEGV